MGSQKRTNTCKHKFMKEGPGWKCAYPNCPWFVYFKQERLRVFAKNSVCWECNKEFIMDEDTMKMDMPTCAFCRSDIESGKTYEDYEKQQKIKNIQEKGLSKTIAEVLIDMSNK